MICFNCEKFLAFQNIVPKTCENYRLLCTGERGRSETTSNRFHYKNTLINRIVPNGWIQGGGIFIEFMRLFRSLENLR